MKLLVLATIIFAQVGLGALSSSDSEYRPLLSKESIPNAKMVNFNQEIYDPKTAENLKIT